MIFLDESGYTPIWISGITNQPSTSWARW